MHQAVANLANIKGAISANAPALVATFMFGFVLLAVLAATHIVQRRQAIRRRAIAFNPASHPGSGAWGASGPARPPQDPEAAEFLYQVERGLGATKDMALSPTRRELIRAGYFSSGSVVWLHAMRLVLACAVPLLVLAVVLRFFPAASPAMITVWLIIGATLGVLAPRLFLRQQQERLLRQCRDGLPNFLDLLVVCSEAGLTPRAGIERISRELTRTHPFLGANLFLMCLELRAGRPLSEAVDSLGRRVQLQEVRSLGALLQQTEELGTNLSGALRVYSEEMRSRRLLRAEERAQVLPVKLVLPLAFFVFPVMLVVALMPVFVRIHRALF
jgi:tight adherence protein C